LESSFCIVEFGGESWELNKALGRREFWDRGSSHKSGDDFGSASGRRKLQPKKLSLFSCQNFWQNATVVFSLLFGN
jgi:hypothetical protein